MERYIGGEFWYDDNLFNKKRTPFKEDTYFLSGGRASLQIICEYLLTKGINRILLPSYMCPSILNCFQKNNFNFDFFRIYRDFKIDLTDLRKKAEKYKAILFINYFGMGITEEEENTLNELQGNGNIIIQDNVQGLFCNKKIGSFVFNSFRKFVPFDGSMLYSTYELSGYIDQYNQMGKKRKDIIHEARELKRRFIVNNIGDETKYLRLFEKAEKLCDDGSEIVGDDEERVILESIDWEKLSIKRNSNYVYLKSRIQGEEGIDVVFSKINDGIIPLGMPVYIKKNRDFVKAALMECNIFLPVHWDIRFNEFLNKNDEAVSISNQILTLVIDQRYGIEDMEFMVEKLISIIRR